MSKSDTHSIISILWLIAGALQPEGSGFNTACIAFFAWYSLSAAYHFFKKVKS